MRRAIKLAVAIIAIFFLVPILPLNLPQYYFYPWSEQATCGPNIGDIQVFSSVGLFLTTVGLVVVPSSSHPVQFFCLDDSLQLRLRSSLLELGL